MEYYSAVEGDAFESVLRRQLNLEPIIQSEVNQKEKNKHCMSMHIHGIQKDGTDEPIGRAATDIKNRLMDMGGWEEGVGEANGESSKEAYTLPHIKQTTNGDSLYDSGSSNQGSVTTQRGGKGWEVGG